MDRSLASDSSKGAVYFLPSVSSFLHAGKQASSKAAHHQAPLTAGGGHSCRAATLRTACQMLSQGLSACERQLSLATGPMAKQSMGDAQLLLQEQLYYAVASLKLPLAFNSQLFLAEDGPPAAAGHATPRCFDGLRQLVAVRADPVAQTPLAALAERTATSRTIATDAVANASRAAGGQPMFHSELGYESIGRICVLQVWVGEVYGCLVLRMVSMHDPCVNVVGEGSMAPPRAPVFMVMSEY